MGTVKRSSFLWERVKWMTFSGIWRKGGGFSSSRSKCEWFEVSSCCRGGGHWIDVRMVSVWLLVVQIDWRFWPWCRGRKLRICCNYFVTRQNWTAYLPILVAIRTVDSWGNNSPGKYRHAWVSSQLLTSRKDSNCSLLHIQEMCTCVYVVHHRNQSTTLLYCLIVGPHRSKWLIFQTLTSHPTL